MKYEENSLQEAIVQHLLIRGNPDAIWYHPNNGQMKSIRAAVRMKRMGLVAGIPDLAFVLPDGMAAYLELKRPAATKSQSGRLSPAQKAFEAKCVRLGIPHAVVADLDSALAILKGWDVLL